MSRKDKKDIKRRTADANRLDNFDDIGDVGDFEEIAKLVGRSSSGAAGGSARGSLAGMDEDDDEDYGRKGKAGANALQRAVAAMSGRKGGMDSDDEEDEVEQMLGGAHKRRRAPEGRMDEEEDTLLEDFGSKKKAFLAKKTHAEKVALRGTDQLKPIIARIEAEKASKSTSKIDANALLGELNGAAADDTPAAE